MVALVCLSMTLQVFDSNYNSHQLLHPLVPDAINRLYCLLRQKIQMVQRWDSLESREGVMVMESMPCYFNGGLTMYGTGGCR